MLSAPDWPARREVWHFYVPQSGGEEARLLSVISLYTTNPKLRSDLLELLSRLDREGPEPVCAEGFSNFSAFLDSGRQNPCRILMLAQEGAKGVELAAAAVEECPESPVIWFSDLDFALFSYRLEVAHFAMLPGTPESLRTALNNCRHKRQGSRAGPPLMLPAAKPPPCGLWTRLRRLLGSSLEKLRRQR